VQEFTESISVDKRLYRCDIDVSLAHAEMLAHVGLLSADELNQISDQLRAMQSEIERGDFRFQVELEDIHMHIEHCLIDRLGDVGRKLHAGRSRNDQVSTDLRLWARDAIDQLISAVRKVQTAFVQRCAADTDVILPAYTHLQQAQPVLAPHYWLAYCEKLERDVQRLRECRARTNLCSLGTAAVAGTALPIDREYVAKRLRFDGLCANSLDASSDRDFAVELVFAMTLLAEHLSAWAAEWVLWSTAEFRFIDLPQAYCTGSSLMPHKVNPDVLELIRAKCARAIGNLQTLLTLIKGMPLAYHRDLQEDKRPLFDTFDNVLACLTLAAPLISAMTLRREDIRQRIQAGYLDATSLMEHLVERGIPHRTAHQRVGQLVALAIRRGVPLAKLCLTDLQKVCPQIDGSVYDVLGVENAVRAFRSAGSTAPSQVARQIDQWTQRLAAEYAK
jgi:argininosuccinate lyase